MKLLPLSLLICIWMLTNKRFETATLLARRREEQACMYFMDFLDECEGNKTSVTVLCTLFHSI